MIITAIESVLNDDPVLTTIVGLDENGFMKIYSSIESRPVEDPPPFVAFQVLTGPPPAGTYGNPQDICQVIFQVSSWGRNSREVWEIDGIVEEALRRGDWATYLLPDQYMRLSADETPGELPDLTTRWRQIPRRWRLDLDRG